MWKQFGSYKDAPGHDGVDILDAFIDDIAETRFALTKLISFEPDMMVVAHAGDGREGLRVAWDERPDIVLMDIFMPVMDGITATECLAAVWSSPPVIVISITGQEGVGFEVKSRTIRGRSGSAGERPVEPVADDAEAQHHHARAHRHEYAAEGAEQAEGVSRARPKTHALLARAAEINAVHACLGADGPGVRHAAWP